MVAGVTGVTGNAIVLISKDSNSTRTASGPPVTSSEPGPAPTLPLLTMVNTALVWLMSSQHPKLVQQCPM